MTTEQNLYACAAERRFLLMISWKDAHIEEWGRVVDSLYANDWREAAKICDSIDLTQDSEKILSLGLTT